MKNEWCWPWCVDQYQSYSSLFFLWYLGPILALTPIRQALYNWALLPTPESNSEHWVSEFGADLSVLIHLLHCALLGQAIYCVKELWNVCMRCSSGIYPMQWSSDRSSLPIDLTQELLTTLYNSFVLLRKSLWPHTMLDYLLEKGGRRKSESSHVTACAVCPWSCPACGTNSEEINLLSSLEPSWDSCHR